MVVCHGMTACMAQRPRTPAIYAEGAKGRGDGPSGALQSDINEFWLISLIYVRMQRCGLTDGCSVDACALGPVTLVGYSASKGYSKTRDCTGVLHRVQRLRRVVASCRLGYNLTLTH